MDVLANKQQDERKLSKYCHVVFPGNATSKQWVLDVIQFI
jgi:hypothetical protein